VIVLLVVFAIVALILALVVAVGLEPSIPPAEVAVAYELARDRHDAVSLWGLSGSELRAGRTRKEFIAVLPNELAEEPRDQVSHVEVDDEYVGHAEASILSVVHLRAGAAEPRRTLMVKEQGTWRVVTWGPAARPDTSRAT
jgi:hypothetical protein